MENIDPNKILLLALNNEKTLVGIQVFYKPFSNEFTSFEEYTDHCMTTALELKEAVDKSYCNIENNPRIRVNPEVDTNYSERVEALYKAGKKNLVLFFLICNTISQDSFNDVFLKLAQIALNEPFSTHSLILLAAETESLTVGNLVV